MVGWEGLSTVSGLFDRLMAQVPTPDELGKVVDGLRPERAAGERPLVLADLERHEHDLHDILSGIQTILARMAEEVERKRPYREIVQMIASGTPYVLRTRGYRHNRVWCTAAVTLTVTNSIGNGNLSLVAGWNVLDMPEGTELTVTAPATIWLELTDDPVQ